LKTIGHILDSIIRELGIQNKLAECRVLEIWPAVVGTQVAHMTKAQRVTKGKLFVHVKSDSWRTELIFHKDAIIKKLNQELRSDVVKEIVFI
jgi:predicted nucleic acid-binding Zn ribbon protein